MKVRNMEPPHKRSNLIDPLRAMIYQSNVYVTTEECSCTLVIFDISLTNLMEEFCAF